MVHRFNWFACSDAVDWYVGHTKRWHFRKIGLLENIIESIVWVL
jgi:hypothetical protein